MFDFFLLFFFFLFVAFFLFFTTQAYNMLFRGYAPFVSSRPKAIKEVLKELKELKINPRAAIYELGAGRAGFLRAARQRFPQAELVGVEYSFLPLFLGKMQSALTNSKIKFIKKNIFSINLGKADVIYCYLNTDTTKRLEAVLKRECRPGTTIISYQCPFPRLNPIKTVSLNNNKDKIYFYQL